MYSSLSLGFGLGLRPAHLPDILKLRPKLGWFEILSDNYLNQKGLAWETLQEVRRHYPLVMHGVSLSIGGTDPLDLKYLANLKALAETTQAKIVSDHLCFTGMHGINTHDLLPLPYNEESLSALCLIRRKRYDTQFHVSARCKIGWSVKLYWKIHLPISNIPLLIFQNGNSSVVWRRKRIVGCCSM